MTPQTMRHQYKRSSSKISALVRPAASASRSRFTTRFVTLPEARTYAAAATRRREGDKVGHYECLTPGLQTLEGAWPGIIAAVPQLTPVDVPVDARLVFVDYEYM